MFRSTMLMGLGAGCLLVTAASAWAAPTVKEMLSPGLQPAQRGVNLSTPTPEEYESCEVKLVTGPKNASGWLLVDAKKQPLRRFYDSNGDKGIDIRSFYKDGVEVYREVDSNGNNKIDQFRWLHAGGCKWGVDINEDGKIDAWRMISAEEAGQEAFEALSAGDFERLRMLLITEAEVKALKLPAAKADKILAQVKNARAKFDGVVAKQTNLAKSTFLRTESAVPACITADELGTDQDLIIFETRPIIYEFIDAASKGEKKHDWLHTGEIIQVGNAWRLTDVPAAQQAGGPGTPEIASDPANTAELQRHFAALDTHTKAAPAPLTTPKRDAAVADYNTKRVEIIEKILPLVKAEDRETWLRQIFDNLSAAYQAGHEPSLGRLSALRDQIVKASPAGNNLAAYGVYREMWSQYSLKINNERLDGPKLAELQKDWNEKLAAFVQTYPKADDTPDVLGQLAMNAEYAGKNEEARRWYKQIYTNFSEHYMAEKSKGAERRLGLLGRELELTGPLVGGGKFNLAEHKNKVVVVYYWASHVGVCARDLATIKQIHSLQGAKGLEVVTVSLDDRAEDAAKFLHTHQVPGKHLFEAAKDNHGLNSPLAVQYGINGLPTLFLIGRDGRVISFTLQVNDLEDAIKKAL